MSFTAGPFVDGPFQAGPFRAGPFEGSVAPAGDNYLLDEAGDILTTEAGELLLWE